MGGGNLEQITSRLRPSLSSRDVASAISTVFGLKGL